MLKNLIFSLLLLSLATNAQNCKNLVLKTADEYINRSKSISMPINNIEYKPWKRAIEAKLENGEKQLYKLDSIWGYQTEKCVVAKWIREQNTFFYIRESKGIVVYLGEIQQGMKHLPGTPDGRGTSSGLNLNFFWGRNYGANYYPFFSKTLDSEPMVLNWENLKEAYKDDKCFMKKLETIDGFFKEAHALEKDSNKLKINILYKDCHNEAK